MYRQSEKIVTQQYLTHMSSQYGELQPTKGRYPFGSLGHTSKFQWVSHLGSVTGWHSSSGRQPNFAALNRGRHQYSAGRPSRWALAHILVIPRLNFMVTSGILQCYQHLHYRWWRKTPRFCRVFLPAPTLSMLHQLTHQNNQHT